MRVFFFVARTDFFGDFFGLVTALGLAIGAVIVRSAKKKDLVPAAVAGKLIVAMFAIFFGICYFICILIFEIVANESVY